jgi:hypothetical protein
MIELYGIPRCGIMCLVATFDTVEQAQAYIEASRLKRRRHNYRYRATSVLRDYTMIKIEFEPVETPHNPTL